MAMVAGIFYWWPKFFGRMYNETWGRLSALFVFIGGLSAATGMVIVETIALSTMVGMGAAGFAGVKLTPIAMSAPIVILTLAVADSIHILLSLRGLIREACREREIPLLFIEFDYNDDRVLAREQMRAQIEDFFTTVME